MAAAVPMVAGLAATGAVRPAALIFPATVTAAAVSVAKMLTRDQQ